ncbi:uncharacterized protein PRCAT00001692001 [Priceomyces carsonii]|uniref:uncharacterized protein n=1 Tax=Priceomyces carsonii TaxID=28549 RepID=UPI002ED9E3FC|nr:unnamed protein product [Priceomyces carsonii]
MSKEDSDLKVNVGITERQSLKFNAKLIAYAHSICAYSAFALALIVGCLLHYKKIVQNSSFGYPDEWFPSVSATIGDRYPERSVFQILIALTSGPRFLLLFFNFIRLYRERSIVPFLAITSGVIRTFTCGGWVYITSTDDHDWHDIFMISYIVLTIPWTICITLLSDKNSIQRKGRKYTSLAFFGMLFPLVYWFIQHKVHVRAGAYSVYAYFEWALIILDIGFDSWSIIDFSDIQIAISYDKIELLHVPKSQIEPSINKSVDTDEFSFLDMVANIINSFMFWTILSSLFLCVWYFPLWHMGLSGYEAVVTSQFLSPLILFIPGVRAFFGKTIIIIRAATVILGIGAYKASDPEHKLMAICAANCFSVICLVTEIAAHSGKPKKLNSYSISFILGLFANSVFKFSCYSNNPIWPVMHGPNDGFNNVGIFVGLCGAFFSPKLLTNYLLRSKRSGGSILLAALGLGGYFFSLHALLSDSSTLVFWVWDGYPIKGPTPLTGALIHFTTVGLGILLSIKLHPSTLSSKFYNIIIGGGSIFILFELKDWLAYIGATVYSFYLASLCPIILQSVIDYNPALMFFLGFLFSIIMSLASVWTVAYAFVPGGWLLRERSDIVFFGALGMIYCGVLNFVLRHRGSHITRLNDGTQVVFNHALKILLVLLALSLSSFIKRYPDSMPIPYNRDSGSFTTGIWCVHFGLDNDMWSSEIRMRDLIRDAEVDIIGLLETDTERLIGGNRDFTQRIAEDLGMYVDYGPGPNKHTWGAALLSKFPIINSTHHLLPSPVGELAPAIHATLNIYGELIDVVVFHSGQEEDEEDRRLQSLAIRDIMAESERPLILLSYLVTTPLEGNYNTYVSEESRMHDIDSSDWDRWCEYILFRDVKKVAYARISRSTITDTELQIAKFKLLTENEREEMDFDLLYGNHHVPEEEISPDLRMPSMFLGDGVRGHRYHVFDEPRYFAQEMSG